MTHAKAKHHIGKAGAAIEKGDAKVAAHHLGHALSSLRSGASDDVPDAPPDFAMATDGDDVAPESSLRDRLKRFKKSDA